MEQKPPDIFPEIDHTCVTSVRLSNSLGKAVLPFGDGKQMDVICHKTIGKILHTEFLGLFNKQSEVFHSVFFSEKDIHGSNPSLNNVMRISPNDNPFHACHERRIFDLKPLTIKKTSSQMLKVVINISVGFALTKEILKTHLSKHICPVDTFNEHFPISKKIDRRA